MADLDLAQMFAEMAATIDTSRSVSEALEETVRLAVEAVQAADMAGVSWCERGGLVESPFVTDELVSTIDGLQCRLDEGPAFAATEEGRAVVMADAESENRWPAFAKALSELGVRSVLSCQLSSPRKVCGTLNLYARKPDAFDDYCVEVAQIYASHASIIVASRTLERDLHAAIDTRGTIGQAMGILIERHKVEPGQAFDLLVKASQRSHRKLRDIADYLVQTGATP